MHEDFERAIIENPNDLASYSAYADWLQEQGDPRGEFMQTQIALEDEARPKAEREALQARETQLLAEYERAWLGELAPFVLDEEPIYRDIRRMESRFARGWLSELLCRSLSVNEARTLTRTPEAKFLTRLLIEGTAYELPVGSLGEFADAYYEPGSDVPPGLREYDTPSFHALTRAPLLANVRVFRFGDGPSSPGMSEDACGMCHANGEFVHEVVARMSRLEELYLYARSVDADALFALPMGRLRILRYDHARSYPLGVLAANPALSALTHLFCHPHALRPDDPDAYIRLDQLRALCRSPYLKNLRHLYLRLTDFGDEGAEEVVASGILKQMRVLDLSYGCITDAGARALAACPDLRSLHLLDLSQNALGEEGVVAFKGTGVTVKTDGQHGEHPSRIDEHGYLEYLTYGDME